MNVAGHQQARESIADITTEQFDETFKTNFYAMFWLCKAALPHMPAGAGHHQHRLDSVVLAFANAFRLRLDQGRDRRVYQGPGQAGRRQGYPRQCRGARSGVDSASDERRPAAGEDSGKPDAGNPHVRSEEGGGDDDRMASGY